MSSDERRGEESSDFPMPHGMRRQRDESDSWEKVQEGIEAKARPRRRKEMGIPKRFWPLLDGLDLQKTEALRAVEEFLDDSSLTFLVLAGSLGVGKTLAASYALEHAKYGLFVDATQLATALTAQRFLVSEADSPLVFISADEWLNRAASAEGLEIDNPRLHL